jgi:CBS domain-containing protein
MSISALCNRVAVTIHRQATAEDAARLMRSSHVGDVVVVDAADTRAPVGMITDRDIVVKVIAEGLPAAQTPVGSVMSSPVLTLRDDDGLLDALEKMSTRGVRRAPVVDRNGRLRGLISVDDLVRLLSSELAKVGALIAHGQAAEILRTGNSFADEYET